MWAHQSKGPSIAQDKVIQLDPALALLGLNAALEQEELKHFESKHQTEIKKPIQEYTRFMKTVLAPIGVNADLPELLTETEEHNLKNLDRLVTLRQERLRKGLKETLPFRSYSYT